MFVVNFKDRIAAAWDPVSLSSLDYNVGNVTMKGAEVELGQKLNKNFSVYGSLTYTESLMKKDLKVSTTLTEATAGKQMPDTQNHGCFGFELQRRPMVWTSHC